MRTMQDWTPAEKAIWDAKDAVEAAGGSVGLTKAVNLLGEAQDLVATYVVERENQSAHRSKATTLNPRF